MLVQFCDLVAPKLVIVYTRSIELSLFGFQIINLNIWFYIFEIPKCVVLLIVSIALSIRDINN